MSQKEEVSPEQQLYSQTMKGPHTNLGNSVGQGHETQTAVHARKAYIK